MSAIRSALEEIVSTSDQSLSLDELAADVAELLHVSQQVDVLLARKVESIGARDGFGDLGYSSASAFLVDTGRMAPAAARRVVSRARMREKAPLAFAAWADGRISTDQARWLFSAAEGVPDVYPDAEQLLVDVVEGLDVTDTRRAVAYWRQAVDGPGELDPEKQLLRRGLSSSETIDGMRRIDGWLTPTAGAAFDAFLESNMAPPREGDTRTPRQRRHDALEDGCRDWLDNGTTPTVGGEKPHLMVHTDLSALRGLAGGLHEFADGWLVDVDTLRRLACDCSITRIVFGPQGEILDVGRKTRVWTAAQRKAIVARDRYCQGNGCRTKAKYCDIHHEDHWADGGTTNVDSGKLFCRPCHTLEHAKDKRRHRRERART